MDNNRVKVSILCTTYNQSEYIGDAIESFISQVTSFRYEVLINDDASNDGTTEIVLQYQSKYPDLIKVVTHEQNQYSLGRTNFAYKYLYPLARGEFFALCEGDDYWCDENKLQIQYDIMQNYPRCGLCVHASDNVYPHSKKTLSHNIPFKLDCLVDSSYLILNAHPFATNSYFIRRDAYEAYQASHFPELSAHGDQKMSVFFGITGQVYYSSKILSCYRVLAKGSINSAIQNSNHLRDIQKKLLKARYELLDYVDLYTGGSYGSVISDAKKQMKLYYLEAIGDVAGIEREYPDYYSRISAKRKLKLRFKYAFPKSYRAARSLFTWLYDR